MDLQDNDGWSSLMWASEQKLIEPEHLHLKSTLGLTFCLDTHELRLAKSELKKLDVIKPKQNKTDASKNAFSSP